MTLNRSSNVRKHLIHSRDTHDASPTFQFLLGERFIFVVIYNLDGCNLGLNSRGAMNLNAYVLY